jgi:NADPH-dependent curcumin reductase CurA
MRNDVNRQWVLKSRPAGPIEPDTFAWREAPMPVLAPGQFLVRNLLLSFDPAQRGRLNDVPSYLPPVAIGEPMQAGGVGQVIESRHDGYKPGELVQGTLGWQDYVATDGGGAMPMRKVPPGLAPELALSVAGGTGLTAYFGMLEVGQVQAGDTVVVSGAAGATGSVAGQIAKIKGAKRVIGIAGGQEKCAWLTEKAHFDAVIDYKSEDVGTRLDQLAPDGISLYFDNVGGEILNACLARIAFKARIVLCGGIASGYGLARTEGPSNYFQLTIRSARMEGFIVLNYAKRFPEAITALRQWVEAGQIVHRQTIAHGLEKAPETLQGLFRGANFGKQLLQIAEPPLPVV